MKTDTEMILKTMAGDIAPDQTPMSPKKSEWKRYLNLGAVTELEFFKDYNKLKLSMEG